jgi:hypothetical protein
LNDYQHLEQTSPPWSQASRGNGFHVYILRERRADWRRDCSLASRCCHRQRDTHTQTSLAFLWHAEHSLVLRPNHCTSRAHVIFHWTGQHRRSWLSSGILQSVVWWKLSIISFLLPTCIISTRLHGATSQKTVIFILAAVRTWNLTSITATTIYLPWLEYSVSTSGDIFLVSQWKVLNIALHTSSRAHQSFEITNSNRQTHRQKCSAALRTVTHEVTPIMISVTSVPEITASLNSETWTKHCRYYYFNLFILSRLNTLSMCGAWTEDATVRKTRKLKVDNKMYIKYIHFIMRILYKWLRTGLLLWSRVT